MVVNELRSAVTDTLEFIIPPIVRLAIFAVIAHFVTFGVLTYCIRNEVTRFLVSLEVSKIKQMIDSLYLSSIIPILVVLILIAFSYFINKVIYFLGALIPINLSFYGAIHSRYSAELIWLYFPEIESTHKLEIKVNQLLEEARINASYLNFGSLKWLEEENDNKFRNVRFLESLILGALISYLYTVNYIDNTPSSNRLVIIIVVLVCTIFVNYAMIINQRLGIEEAKLALVRNYLILSEKWTPTKNQDEIAQINRIFNTEEASIKRWWSIKLGYRFDWISTLKFYRPPFYKIYCRWNEAKVLYSGGKRPKQGWLRYYLRGF
ncbi:hypothetical protein [Dyadobacter sp. OTU695]|uniref:hypothetical protein n=1 Tax=Dyadobacter sp. OTU695 TaxID=3043860 RepID=UPI00313DFD5B